MASQWRLRSRLLCVALGLTSSSALVAPVAGRTSRSPAAAAAPSSELPGPLPASSSTAITPVVSSSAEGRQLTENAEIPLAKLLARAPETAPDLLGPELGPPGHSRLRFDLWDQLRRGQAIGPLAAAFFVRLAALWPGVDGGVDRALGRAGLGLGLGRIAVFAESVDGGRRRERDGLRLAAVSYTHLTLPTKA